MYGWEGQNVAPRLGRGGGNPGGRACNSGHNRGRLCYNELMSYNEPMSVLPPFLLCKTFLKTFFFFNLKLQRILQKKKEEKKLKKFFDGEKHFKKTFLFCGCCSTNFCQILNHIGIGLFIPKPVVKKSGEIVRLFRVIWP